MRRVTRWWKVAGGALVFMVCSAALLREGNDCFVHSWKNHILWTVCLLEAAQKKKQHIFLVKCFARHFGKIIYDRISFHSPFFQSLTCSANQFFLSTTHPNNIIFFVILLNLPGKKDRCLFSYILGIGIKMFKIVLRSCIQYWYEYKHKKLEVNMFMVVLGGHAI